MYQKILLLLYFILFCGILYISLFIHVEHLSYFTKSIQLNDDIKKYDDYLFDYKPKKIITIQLKNVHIYNLAKHTFIRLLADAINVTTKRIHILDIDKNTSKIYFVIKKVDNVNESSTDQAIELLKTTMKDFNSELMKNFYISFISVKNKYINDNEYESYNEWWNKVDPTIYLK